MQKERKLGMATFAAVVMGFQVYSFLQTVCVKMGVFLMGRNIEKSCYGIFVVFIVEFGMFQI